MVVQRGSACVVLTVEVEADCDLTGWTAGPVSLALPGGAGADRTRRMTYFEPRVVESLYGTADRPVRHHRVLTVGPDTDVEAVELLRPPSATAPLGGLAVFHVRLTGAPLEGVARLTDLGAGGHRYEALLPAGVRLAPDGQRPLTISHVTFADGLPAAPMPAAYDGWGARDQWLWLLASATPVERFPPDPEDLSLFAGRVRFSADWQALVLRDGAAFLGTSPDPGDDTAFHATAASLVRTIYLDAFLIGRLQTTGVNALANTLAGLQVRETEARRLLALEGRLIELRRALWSSHITPHGKANELLERFQEQHRLPQLLDRVGTGLADASRYVEAARARRNGLALGLLSAVGLPFGVAYAAGALWGDPGLTTLLVCTLVAVVATAVLFLLLPPLRGLASDELRKTED